MIDVLSKSLLLEVFAWGFPNLVKVLLHRCLWFGASIALFSQVSFFPTSTLLLLPCSIERKREKKRWQSKESQKKQEETATHITKCLRHFAAITSIVKCNMSPPFCWSKNTMISIPKAETLNGFLILSTTHFPAAPPLHIPPGSFLRRSRSLKRKLL